MESYKIYLQLSEQCPIEMKEIEINYNGGNYYLNLAYKGKEAELYPVEAESHKSAEMLARNILNQLLNYTFSRFQYGPRILPSYRWSNMNDLDSIAVVSRIPKFSWYSGEINIDQEIELREEQRGAAYMRAGDLASSSFDKFRNYYLSVDAIGKRVRGPGDGTDSSLLSDTLEVVVSAEMITALHDKIDDIDLPEEVNLTGDEIDDIQQVLYKNYRCSLMHSGFDDDYFPFNSKDELQVNSALKLMRGTAWQYVKYEKENLI